MTADAIAISHLILNTIKEPPSKQTPSENYQRILSGINSLSSDQIDTLLKIIALFIGSPDTILLPSEKYRLIYLLKAITSSQPIPDQFKLSLQKQKYLLQSLIQIALHNKAQSFPNRGEGLFPSSHKWPEKDPKMNHIANNVIGLTIEILKYWGQKQPAGNLFGDIYQDLVAQFDYEYPDYENFYDEGAIDKIDWKEQNSDSSHPLLTFKNLKEGDLESNIEQIRKTPGKINKMLSAFEQKLMQLKDNLISKVSEGHKTEHVCEVLDCLTRLQIYANTLKAVFKACPILEVTDELFKSAIRARDIVVVFEKLMECTRDFFEKEQKDTEYFSSMIATIESASSSQGTKSQSTHQTGLSISPTTSTSDEPLKLENALSLNRIESDNSLRILNTNSEHQINIYESIIVFPGDEESKKSDQAEIDENDFVLQLARANSKDKPNSMKEVTIPDTDKLQFPAALKRNYQNFSQISEKDGLIIYQAKSFPNERENKRVLITLISKLDWSNTSHRNSLLEVFWRKLVQHPAVKPIIEYSFIPNTDTLWFVEPDIPNFCETKLIIDKVNDFDRFMEQMTRFSVYLKKTHGLVLPNLSSEDINYNQNTKHFMIQNWYKASYSSEFAEESKFLGNLASLGLFILGFPIENGVKTREDWLSILSKMPDEWRNVRDETEWGLTRELLLSCIFSLKENFTLDLLSKWLGQSNSDSSDTIKNQGHLKFVLYNDEKITFFNYNGNTSKFSTDTIRNPQKGMLFFAPVLIAG